ncbi:MAG: type VI secretion system baseplate subunit TssE, partial [Oxalobacteraceae bacterium]
YGLCDFADRSLSSPSDRAHICACIEAAITRHEPRLTGVKGSTASGRQNRTGRSRPSMSCIRCSRQARPPG